MLEVQFFRIPLPPPTPVGFEAYKFYRSRIGLLLCVYKKLNRSVYSFKRFEPYTLWTELTSFGLKPFYYTFLKHVKAWLKPNLHKISKTVITLRGFGIICAANPDDLNTVRPIKSDKIGHVVIINCFIFWKNN